MPQRTPIVALGLACLLGALLACYGPALLGGGQFAYRDASHYYYPLYLRVEQEWRAGRLPLWAPEENGGTPLLGNPTAAVLYPGKLIYTLLPYAWAARVYVAAHTALAFGAMVALLRRWGTSGVGSIVAGLAYAFGGPVLFLHCNIIYLVGAAWLPLALRAADGWVRLGRRGSLAELAVLLALQVLGGDPQSAAVAVLAAAGYAAGLAWTRSPWADRLGRYGPAALVTGSLAMLTVAATIRPWLPPSRGRLAQVVLLLVWAGGASAWLWARRGRASRLRPTLLGLAGSCALAAALTAAQSLPTAEFLLRSVRAAPAVPLSDPSAYALEPYRVVEWLWPNVFGPFLSGERFWLQWLPPALQHTIWVPSLYLGGLTLVLALEAWGFRGGPPGRAWMSALALAGFLASLGGAGGLYELLSSLVPGFSGFRFAGKFLTVTTLALAALAGIGWDRVVAGGQRARWIATVALTLSLAALLTALAAGRPILEALTGGGHAPVDPLFGPFDLNGALADMRRAVVAGTVAQALALGLIVAARRSPGRAGVAAAVVLAADLVLANAGLILTVPQADFERTPAVLRAIRDAERQEPAGSPFRIHVMGPWTPVGWADAGAPGRLREWVDWQRDTLQPSYAVPYGLSYAVAGEGATELYDHWLFFRPFARTVGPRAAGLLGVPPGNRIIYHPRRAFDLWNARYIITPAYAAGWRDPGRSYAAFLDQTDLIYPAAGELATAERRQRWLRTRDVQVRRNRAALPRAWVVHEARFAAPIAGMDEADRAAPLRALLRGPDALDDQPGPPGFDPRRIAWIEVDRPKRLAPFDTGGPPGPGESVTVERHEPTRVDLVATLDRPGFVVLADAFDPGWHLTIDGEPAEILRANRMMRGAPLAAGRHTLTYRYDPSSFRLGAGLSVAGLVALGLLATWAARQSPA